MSTRLLFVKCLLVAGCIASMPVAAQDGHAGHDMSAMDRSLPAAEQVELPTYISSVTEADRVAAFPDAGGMTRKSHMDDNPLQYMVLLDRMEVHGNGGESPFVWDARAWIGKDFDRLLVRSEGDAIDGKATSALLEALWERPVSRWWSLAAGMRHDFRPRESRNWLALGVAGLAPYRIGVDATAYLGESGRTALRLETAYDLLLTNRLILQSRLEINAYGSSDRSRGIGSGLSTAEVGLRLRYELRREIAPYVGITWDKAFGTTADLAQAAGLSERELQAVAGLRVWF